MRPARSSSRSTSTCCSRRPRPPPERRAAVARVQPASHLAVSRHWTRAPAGSTGLDKRLDEVAARLIVGETPEAGEQGDCGVYRVASTIAG